MPVYVVRDAALRRRVAQLIDGLDLGKPWSVDVKPYRKVRSLEQNARLWLLHTAAANFTGHTPEEMHEEALCQHYGYREVRMPTGWIKRMPLKRSSQRDTAEFSKFMEATEAWYATEFGVILPDSYRQ